MDRRRAFGQAPRQWQRSCSSGEPMNRPRTEPAAPADATATARRISPSLVAAVRQRLRAGRRVRRRLPHGGRLHVDRRVPFLFLHRDRAAGGGPGIVDAVSAQCSYLAAVGHEVDDPGLCDLVAAVMEERGRELGAFLLVEVWERPATPGTESAEDRLTRPAFSIRSDGGERLRATVDRLRADLEDLELPLGTPGVAALSDGAVAPPGLDPVTRRCGELPAVPGVASLGLEVEPIYRSAKRGRLFPLVHLALEASLVRVLQQAVYTFTREHTALAPRTPLALARRTLAYATWHVDRRLAEVDSAFEFLLLVSPTNLDDAWRGFAAAGHERAPRFLYRPLPVDVTVLKRRLFGTAIDRVEDPTLGRLFREKQEELDRKLTMLADRGTRRFFYGSLQLYGEVDPQLLGLARQILDRLPRDPEPLDGDDPGVDAATFAALAAEEMADYRRRFSGFRASVRLRGDIASGVMVAKDHLLVRTGIRFPRHRVEPLFHHEIGTHLLTYFNGKAQRLRQFYGGLAGYEALQEGVAVLAEYLCGGLDQGRLRTLAARVVACHAMEEGADFVEVFRLLVAERGFAPSDAFTLAARVFRGGGLTKDAVYLRGLQQVLDHLAAGGAVEPLMAGKIAVRHIPVVEELWHREVFRPVPLLPRYLDDAAAQARLAALRRGASPLDLTAATPTPTREIRS